jgi:di/tricarboxylate transporter
MAADTLFVFVLIAVAAALMASNKLRIDIIALPVVIALMLSGVLTVSEELAGFGSSVVMLVAGLSIQFTARDRLPYQR